MQYTRKLIIDYLKTNHTASVPELSQTLNLTLGNIRHHIKELETQRMIELVGKLPPKGRGRPTQLFSLTIRAVEHNLDSLSEALFKAILLNPKFDKSGNIIQHIADIMLGEIDENRNLTKRTHLAVQWLNKHHYKSRWEASPSGPKVILTHCPYLSILSTTPRICQVDTVLISKLIGLPMEKFTPKKDGSLWARPCVFTHQG